MTKLWSTRLSFAAIMLAVGFTQTAEAQFGFRGPIRGAPIRNAIRQGAPFAPPIPLRMMRPPLPIPLGIAPIAPFGVPRMLPSGPNIRVQPVQQPRTQYVPQQRYLPAQQRYLPAEQSRVPAQDPQRTGYSPSIPAASYPIAPTSMAGNSTPTPTPNIAPTVGANVRSASSGFVARARHDFESQRYADSVILLDQICELLPNDSSAFQFRSFAHFALGNFDAAAADVYDAMQLGNSWDWQTVYELYGNAETYESQMRRLEKHARANKSMSNHFLLAYHYVVLGHYETGKKQFQKVLELQPDEPLATSMIEVLDQQSAN